MAGTPQLEIDPATRRSLVRHATGAHPGEAVGALFGHRGRARWQATDSAALPNRSPRDDRFDADPVAFVRAEAERRRAGLEHLGFYHSHPNGNPAPSAADLAAAWPGGFLVVLANGAIHPHYAPTSTGAHHR